MSSGAAKPTFLPHLTLSQVLVLSFLALIAALGVLFYVLARGTNNSLLASSDSIRDQASREIADRVYACLEEAPETIRRFERELTLGLVDPANPRALESALASLLAGSRNLGEVTLTTARQKIDPADENPGYNAEDDIRLEPASAAQWSYTRSAPSVSHPTGQLWRRRVFAEGAGYAADELELRAGALPGSEEGLRRLSGPIADPSTHATFTSPTRRLAFGEQLATDLHWLQADEDLPDNDARKRVALSYMQGLRDQQGRFLGVLRVGLMSSALDRAVKQVSLTRVGVRDPHRIFVCDTQGRLITPLAPTDRIAPTKEDDLRIMPEMIPGEITAALAISKLRDIGPDLPSCPGAFEHAGKDYLVSFGHLPGTQGWAVGIVVPRDHYLGDSIELRRRLLYAASGIMAALVLGGLWIQRGVWRAQRQIANETRQMNAFEFAPAPTDSAFRDISEVLESLERAKAAMRAMSKYVPIDLVRRLYREKQEPVLGGEQTEISLMFTDIKDFTNFAERLEPNVLADSLGRYLSTMVRIIQQEQRGTIDKFIGDAIMTIWNAPEPIPDHARMACQAALRCRAEAHALSISPEWKDLPPFETRFGLHKDTAMVGHFGAPDRLNYTAIGDAVNLASRLESLNKQYGTSIIVSERIRDEVREHFEFRRLDRVAVKGKKRPIVIFELLGVVGAPGIDLGVVSTYEKAFDAYVAGDFAAAARALDHQLSDPPSAVLRARCEHYLADPPPPDWGGVYVSLTK